MKQQDGQTALGNELFLIQSFVKRDRQERYLNLINTPKGRSKFRSKLAHFKDLDDRFYKIIPHLNTPEQFYDYLISEGFDESVYLISENSKVDGSFTTLKIAMHSFQSGFGYFVVCLTKGIAYYEGEDMCVLLSAKKLK